MSSQSLYRKWRSQTFAEVVGQEHVTRTLLNALRMGRVAHAYLFCGPRGTGKTSTARLLAKAVNCRQNGGLGEPCNECELCHAITEGRSLDVIEIDAASNRGIDEIRDLRDKVNFAPGEARRKFYIIDEVHQLTGDAFNALLKTLEEPPAHTIFILASTEAHKIPATILSRCQRFDFRRIPLREMVARLGHICAQEGIDIEPAALEMVARAATGSLRDAESVLDQLHAYAEGPITVAQVEDLLGAGGSAAVRDLVALMFRGDLGGGLRLINRLVDEGFDMRQLGRQIVAHLRDLLLVKTGAVPAEGLDVTAETASALAQLAQTVATEDILRALRSFGTADPATRGLVQPQLPLEMAFATVVLGEAERASGPSVGVEGERKPVVARGRAGPAAGAPALRQTSAPTIAAAPAGEAAQPAAQGAERPATASADQASRPRHPAASSPAESEPQAARPVARAEAAGPLALEGLREAWGTVLEAIGRVDKRVQAFLRDSTGPERIEDGAVVLGFRFAFHKEQIEQQKNRAVVETAMRGVLGQPCRIRCELSTRQGKVREQASVLEDPLVREALSQGGRIKGIKNTAEMENSG